VFWGTQLGILISESLGNPVRLVYNLAPCKNWKKKDSEMDLFAQLLLESRTGAYLEWLDNELIMTANKEHT
jgi:hypothetical protein